MAIEPGDNILGALIFFSYIIAALFFSGLIVRDLAISWRRLHDAKGVSGHANSLNRTPDRRKRAIIFIALSLISFVTLTYNMLGFLILSYQDWASSRGLMLPQSILGDNSLSVRPLYVWKWATSSTLFKDFSMSICARPIHFWWARLALLYTFGWNSFMTVAGITSSIPNLWAYFVLGQILPVSFVQNLFCTALSLALPVSNIGQYTVSGKRVQVLTTLGYLLCLAAAPALVLSTQFLWMILIIRLLLFAPYVLFQPVQEHERFGRVESLKLISYQYRWIFRLTFVGSLLFLAGDMPNDTMSLNSIRDNYAVSTLGFDYIVALLSAQVFWLTSS